MGLRPVGKEQRLLTLPVAGLVVIILAVGVMPEPLLQIAERAAAGLLEPDAYIEAVLGERDDDLAALKEFWR